MVKFFLFFLTLTAFAQSEDQYKKHKSDTGQLISEGWVLDGFKNDYWITYFLNGNIASKGHFKTGLKEKYWYFYRENGLLEKEGHFTEDLMSSWWVFYTENGKLDYKVQYKEDKKQGYCIRYKKNKIVKIEKFDSDKKVGEWKDLKSFELENDLQDLR